MNVNLELYKIFIIVAEKGNITKASKELLISQPAITKSIKNLEDQLGGQLFLRTKRGVILTDEGKDFYNNIKIAMEHIHNSERKFDDAINLETGSIKIGLSSSFRILEDFLIPYLSEFSKRYPKISIQLIEGYTTEIIQKLKDGLLDVAILKLPYKQRKDLDIIECKQIQDCFVVNNSYPELINKTVMLEDLSNDSIIGLVKPPDITGSYLEKLIKESNIVLKIKIECNNASSIVSLTKAGLGVGYTIKEHVEEEIKNKELFVLDVEPKIPNRYIGIATAKNQKPSFSAQKLIELISSDKNN